MENTNKDAESENHQPWNIWFRQARSGDKAAAHNIITASQPFIRHLCKDPYLRKLMSQDEICSNAHFALLKFINKPKDLPPDAEVPFLLRYVLKCEMKDYIRHMDVLEEHEQLAITVKAKGALPEYDYNENDCNEAAATDKTTEPETYCLNNELCIVVREAVQQLPENEKTIINGFYFQHKGMKEIAQELHCTFQNAYKMRNKAYTRLHKILKNTMYA